MLHYHRRCLKGFDYAVGRVAFWTPGSNAVRFNDFVGLPQSNSDLPQPLVIAGQLSFGVE